MLKLPRITTRYVVGHIIFIEVINGLGRVMKVIVRTAVEVLAWLTNR